MLTTLVPRGRSVVIATAGLLFAACSGGSKGDPENRGDFKVVSIGTGSGAIYPYRIRRVDSFGNPTSAVLNVESDAILRANVNGNNGVLPVATFNPAALLPDGSPGNHFMHFEFSHKLDVPSILSGDLGNQTNSGLTGSLVVLDYDQTTESTRVAAGRGFVNGYTYFNEGGTLRLVKAVEADGDNVRILDVRANGFPQYAGAAALVNDKSFVFVADADGDLSTAETFRADRLLRVVVSNAVKDSENDILDQELCTATTVGDDPSPPQVLGYTTQAPEITPGRGQTGIDPQTTILIRFNKPVQPGEVGSFFDPQQFVPPSGGVTLNVTAAAQTFAILYHADPVSFADFCNYVITPAYNLPGQSEVVVTVQDTTIHSLTAQLIGDPVSTRFRTSAGPGIVNAPVAPEVIYVGIGGATPGVSVIDLNGFGQGTGDLTNTRFPMNPNIGQPGVFPPLAPGTSNMDAGSGGALTLTKDTNLNTRLLRDPVIGSVTDIHIGAPLDLVFNNENVNVNVTRANQTNPLTNIPQSGNCISVAPHPNPPRLVFPPPNPNRLIFGEEPTQAGGLNLLTQGNPFATELGQLGIYGTIQTGVFNGPAPPPLSPPPPTAYTPFAIRQQVGHFLYVLDADNRQIVVVNSNRMTVLDTIPMTDPVDMAMAPNLSYLAVANFAASSIAFIDINPLSNRFHEVVAETRTDRGPSSVAWQPDGEDVLAVCSVSNTLTLIAARDFTVRRTASGFLNEPIDIAITPRYVATGFAQGLYFAYILNANGSIAVYESGPDGVNGIGFNDMIGTIPNATFNRARKMRLDYSSANGALHIGHTDENGLGQVSLLDMTSSPGVTPLNPNIGGFLLPPTFRQKEWTVVQRFGGLTATTAVRPLLSGNSVVDLTVDDLINGGGLPGQGTPFNGTLATSIIGHSGKDGLKGTTLPLAPRLLFVAYSDVGKIDVVEMATGRRIRTLDMPGVRVLASYWRQ